MSDTLQAMLGTVALILVGAVSVGIGMYFSQRSYEQQQRPRIATPKATPPPPAHFECVMCGRRDETVRTYRRQVQYVRMEVILCEACFVAFTHGKPEGWVGHAMQDH